MNKKEKEKEFEHQTHVPTQYGNIHNYTNNRFLNLQTPNAAYCRISLLWSRWLAVRSLFTKDASNPRFYRKQTPDEAFKDFYPDQ